MTNLYQREELLVHMKEPLNRKKLKDYSYEVDMVNRSCGDELKIYLKVGSNNVIEDIGYVGDACGVAIASASMLSEQLKGKSLEYIKNLEKSHVLANFNNNLTSSRIPCALLIYDGVKKICKQKK